MVLLLIILTTVGLAVADHIYALNFSNWLIFLPILITLGYVVCQFIIMIIAVVFFGASINSVKFGRF